MKIKLALAFLAFVLSGCSSGFSEEDIANVKNSIKSEFEKKDGFTVKEVYISKENSKKLMGFVKIHISDLGDITRSCSATMDESGKSYIWRCD